MSAAKPLTDAEAELVFEALAALIEVKRVALRSFQSDLAITERDLGIPQLEELLKKLGNSAEITYSGALE